jgi:hypothetical protein
MEEVAELEEEEAKGKYRKNLISAKRIISFSTFSSPSTYLANFLDSWP